MLFLGFLGNLYLDVFLVVYFMWSQIIKPFYRKFLESRVSVSLLSIMALDNLTQDARIDMFFHLN